MLFTVRQWQYGNIILYKWELAQVLGGSVFHLNTGDIHTVLEHEYSVI